MPHLHRVAPPFVLAAAACVVLCAAEPPAKPSKDQIAQWVKQLGDDDFSTREEASAKLYQAGKDAEEALQEAVTSDDAEVARRARAILDKFKWGLYPDATKSVVDTINRYRAADVAGKLAVVQELLDGGPSGWRTLLGIVRAEPDAEARTAVLSLVTRQLSHSAPQMLADGNNESLELLLDVLVANDARQGAPHYAAYWMMRGKLDERIGHYKALAAKGLDPSHDWEVVAHLCHARGDLAAAREAADKAGKPELADAMLLEAGDWKTLADRPVHSPSGLNYEDLALQATYHRLAGDAKGFDDALAELRKLADAPLNKPDVQFQLAKVLFFNDRPNDAVEVLAATPGRRVDAFEMLVAQGRIKEALELADKVQAENVPESPVLEVLKARTLYLLGEKDKAKAIFKAIFDALPGSDFAATLALVDAENRVGLRDRAFEHAAQTAALPQSPNWWLAFVAKLYPKNTDSAAVLWRMLASHDTRPTGPAAALKQLHGLLDGTADAKAVADLADRAEAEFKVIGAADDLAARRRALAEAALACKDETLARSLLEKAGTADALIRLGDLDADKKEWDKAEKWYAQAWDKDHGRPLALYLDGYALAQAGKEEEGKQRMELAHWTPLGDSATRFALLQALSERGHHEAARREAELLARLSPAGTLYASEGQRLASRARAGPEGLRDRGRRPGAVDAALPQPRHPLFAAARLPDRSGPRPPLPRPAIRRRRQARRGAPGGRPGPGGGPRRWGLPDLAGPGAGPGRPQEGGAGVVRPLPGGAGKSMQGVSE